jgi:hydrogenase/urease accessory protein HupE
LVRLKPAGGRTQVAVLRTPADVFIVPEQAGRVQAAAAYFQLGLDHILKGVDHLLFVLGLLLLVQDRMMLIKTITAFTVAHSITLAIATLGYASVALPPLNVAIALSIFYLGPEIIRKQRGKTSLTIEYPWLVAFVFGLLHGFGFASGLTSLGLPQADIPFALLMFNLGVEFGQLCFVFIILALVHSFKRLEIVWPQWVTALPCYTVGSLGAFWTIQRVAILFQS